MVIGVQPTKEKPLSDNLSQSAPTLHNVSVFHNVFRDPEGRGVGFLGYAPSHPMTNVFTYKGVARPGAGVEAILENAFKMFNIGEEGTAAAYRARNLRSLSVGDMVSVDGTYFAIEPLGFRQLDAEPIHKAVAYPGTTPIRWPVAA